jgi:DNA-binding winged helix-turn-helix (wHTH) protein
MTQSALATASGDSLLPAEPALAPFHPEPGGDARRDRQTSDTDQPSFGKRTNRSVPAPSKIAFGSFRLLPAQFLLLEGAKPVRLGSRALEILVVLLERPGELVSKQELMGRVWPNIFVEPANLTVHISALRRTLRDGRDGNRFIINVPGRGYIFVAPVEVSGQENRLRTAFATPLVPAGSSRAIAGGHASRLPTANELPGARYQAASSTRRDVSSC